MTVLKQNLKKRAAGIEPASSAWKAEVLPLNYARANTKKVSRKLDHSNLAYIHYYLPHPSSQKD